LVLAAEAQALGWGGIELVHRATSSTVSLNQESRPHQTQGCSASQLRE
jgi:hypothetical protein